jgi:hypothetical protein
MGLALWVGEWFRLGSQGNLPDLRHRCRRSAKPAHLELFLLDLLCQFDAPDHHRCHAQTLQSQHRAKRLFNSSVVLFHEVVQVFAGPYQHALRQLAIALWTAHFRFANARLLGLTPNGRATINVLAMNAEDLLLLRVELLHEGTTLT